MRMPLERAPESEASDNAGQPPGHAGLTSGDTGLTSGNAGVQVKALSQSTETGKAIETPITSSVDWF